MRGCLVAWSALSLFGCAIATPHMPISQWPVTKRAMYYREAAPYRVAVLPLVDQRPAEERRGKRPAGLFLLLWNRRKGDYTTGDRVFGGAIATDVSQQLASYLQAANVFAQVVHVASPGGAAAQADPMVLRQIAQEHAADYLLSGELQHFFGSQYQHTGAFFIPLYFISAFGWNEQKSLPWGQTTIRVALYDGRSGDLMWRRQFEARETMPRERDAMSEAALESLVTVAGDLAVELRQLPYESLDPAIIP